MRDDAICLKQGFIVSKIKLYTKGNSNLAICVKSSMEIGEVFPKS